MNEQEKSSNENNCPSCGAPAHAGHTPECSLRDKTVKDSEDQFGTHAYDTKYEDENEQPRRVVKDFIRVYVPKGAHCLDLGCGAGRHSEYLAEQGVIVTGVDRATTGVKKTQDRLRRFPESSARVADIHMLPFTDQQFDSCISNRVLDYNDDEGVDRAFAELARVLKDSAPAFLTVRSSAQSAKNNEQEISRNENGGTTFTVRSGRERGALQHYFTELELHRLAEHHHLEIITLQEDRSQNKQGENKAEWQVTMRKMKRENK